MNTRYKPIDGFEMNLSMPINSGGSSKSPNDKRLFRCDHETTSENVIGRGVGLSRDRADRDFVSLGLGDPDFTSILGRTWSGAS